MKPRHYVIVLFCAFWFLATFSAWHDADKNLSSVIKQRSEDNSQLGECRADLRVSNEVGGFYQRQFNASQTSIDTLQTAMGSQQAAMNLQQSSVNSCVQELIKKNTPVPLAFVTKWAITSLSPFNAGRPGENSGRVVLFTVETNHQLSPLRAKFTCKQSFVLLNMTLGGKPAMVRSFVPQQVSATEADLEMTISAWDPQSPIFIAVGAEKLQPDECMFALQ